MEPDRTIYLDHAATSPLRSAVWEAMAEVRGSADFNPASQHGPGRAAADRLEEARRTLAAILDVPRRRVVFTGGGTASDNVAVLGFARAHSGDDASGPPLLLVSAVEHKAVLRAAEQASREGAEVRRIPVDAEGVADLDWMEEQLTSTAGRPTLISLMWANNEVGAIQPVREAAELARSHGATLHTDAVQAFGKLEVTAAYDGIHLLSATAHKLGGPVGIGLLYVSEDVQVDPLLTGGTQEGGLWPGTQNPVAAAGFAEAARLAVEERADSLPLWEGLRDRLSDALSETVRGLRVRSAGAPRRLPHVLNVGIPGVDQSGLLVSLDMEGVALSTGSACASGGVEPSHVLEAMGEPGPDEFATLRFSFGPGTDREDVDAAAEAVSRVMERLSPERAPAGRGAARSPGGGNAS